jgi:8-hydroxy-5-deazaflavin:NADPH oxidoreductase
VLQDWSGKIVIDVTNGLMLPPEVQQAEYQGRLTSEVNAERVPRAKLVKAFNQLPLKVLASPLPDDVGRRAVFVLSDHEDENATVAALAESLGFAAIEVGKIAEGGRLIPARASLVFRNLIKYPMRVGRKATVHRRGFVGTLRSAFVISLGRLRVRTKLA